MHECSNGVKEECWPWSIKAGILTLISPLRVSRKNDLEACKPQVCYCAVAGEPHWGLLFALSPPRWTFKLPTASAVDKISSETGHVLVSRCSVWFSCVFIIVWGSSSGFKFNLYVQSWPECIHLFSHRNKIIVCCTFFFSLSPNYSRTFLLSRYFQSNTGPLLSTTCPDAGQASYCVFSRGGGAVPAAERRG